MPIPEKLQKMRARQQSATSPSNLWVAATESYTADDMRFTISDLSMEDVMFIFYTRRDIPTLLDIVENICKIEAYADPESDPDGYDQGRSDVLNEIRALINTKLKELEDNG